MKKNAVKSSEYRQIKHGSLGLFSLILFITTTFIYSPLTDIYMID